MRSWVSVSWSTRRTPGMEHAFDLQGKTGGVAGARAQIPQAGRQPADTDRWTVDEGRRGEERQQDEVARPAAPEWLLELGLNSDHAVYIHRGGCWNAGKRSRGTDETTVRQALVGGGAPCSRCQP
ncbi:DUF6233 domain-containing protein [Streptomyces sp. NPDC052301]|uniref:DUF6233 domain-containing protein n=1 Tax=Streptomyces sp. NPDC052301 TaxID=3365687 RepID=UPI0037D93735